MTDEQRPDGMQIFYRRYSVPSPGVPEDLIPTEPPPPLPRISIRWSGFLILMGFIGVVAVIARFSVHAAEALVVLVLVSLAANALANRRRRQRFAREGLTDGLVWAGDGGAADYDAGVLDVGGGGDGGS